MVFFNYALRKLNAKIVYYGPGLCGKTTNLAWIHDNFEGGERGKMISLATEGDRTIFFDLLPLEIGAIRGMDVTLQLYTVPGQVHYNSTRQLVLRGADGVVFVADSQRAMQSSNTESFRNLQENLLLQGIALEGFPLALQFNKRDLKDTLSVEELNEDLNIYKVPIFEAVATEGMGVQETLEGIVKLVMRSLRERYEGASAGPRTPGIAEPGTARAPFAPQSPPTVAPGPAPVETPKPPPEPVAPPTVAPAPEPKPPEPPPPRQPPKLPDYVEMPSGDNVFGTDEGAQTTDFSKTVGPEVFGDGKPDKGFEDEVSTAVYDVNDEIEIEPGDFKEFTPPAAPETPPTPEPPPVILPDPVKPVFEDEPTSAGVTASPDHEFATGGGAAAHNVVDVEQEFRPAPDFDVPPTPEPPASEADVGEPAFDEEPVIEFLSVDEDQEPAPPTADLPPPSERYVDQIVAPSPFAPRFEAAPANGEVVADISDDILQALVKAEEEDEIAIMGSEPEEATPDAEAVEPDLESDATVPFAPMPAPEAEGDDTQPHPPEQESVMVVGEGEDPFGVEEEPVVELEQPAAIEAAGPRDVDVRATDNQLHLRLQGTGAIVESGQVRELDIEVPVPGAWVGHRRVTLQLRLTLTPDTEDEDGGNSPS